MNLEKLKNIESQLSDLSIEEGNWLLEIITKNLRQKQIQEMALDLEIQTEIKTINEEFLITEMDGLINNEY